jgi:hypothetical protein
MIYGVLRKLKTRFQKWSRSSSLLPGTITINAFRARFQNENPLKIPSPPTLASQGGSETLPAPR